MCCVVWHITYIRRYMKTPEWAQKHRLPGTELRFLGGKYRLYKITSRWNSEKKRAQKVTLEFLGTITEKDGLLKPKIARVKESLDKPSILEWGSHYLVEVLNVEVRENLEKYFPDCWKEIWIAAQMRFIHQAPIKNWAYHYERSYLTQMLPGVKLSAKSCGSLLQRCGANRYGIVGFLRDITTDENEHILVDTTHVVSQSTQIDIVKKGYNSANSFEPQINLFYVFNVDQKVPVYYRMLPGNVREISAMKLSIEESGFKNVTLVGDKGFYSAENVSALEQAGLRYILPLRRNNSQIDYTHIAKGDKQHLDGYFLFNNRVVWYKQICPQTTIFVDEQLKLQESTDYLSRINEQCEGYSHEHFLSKQHSFGTITLTSNVPDTSSEDLYIRYKARTSIEQVFDTYKNLLHADTTYMQGRDQMEAWSFINFLAMLFYYRTYNTMVAANLLGKFSVRDIIIRSHEYKKFHILNQWKSSEISQKTIKLFTRLSVPIT